MADRTQTVSFRIRKIDSDLAEAIKGIDKQLLASHCRDGLRLMLGLGTTRSAQIVERPINVPLAQTTLQPIREQRQPQSVPGTPAIYKPKS